MPQIALCTQGLSQQSSWEDCLDFLQSVLPPEGYKKVRGSTRLPLTAAAARGSLAPVSPKGAATARTSCSARGLLRSGAPGGAGRSRPSPPAPLPPQAASAFASLGADLLDGEVFLSMTETELREDLGLGFILARRIRLALNGATATQATQGAAGPSHGDDAPEGEDQGEEDQGAGGDEEMPQLEEVAELEEHATEVAAGASAAPQACAGPTGRGNAT